MFLKQLSIIGITLLIFNTAFSQVSVFPLEGCAPLNGVEFNASSMGLANLSWEFGDGTSSVDELAYHNYPNAGTYIVLLTATLNGTAFSEMFTIKVYELPFADFSLQTANTGCIPFSVELDNTTTTAGSATISHSFWTMGDGNTISIAGNQSITHTYNSTGHFDVSLEVVDDHNCSNFILVDSLFAVSAPPNISINSNYVENEACGNPLLLSFSATNTPVSLIADSIEYLWDFDNGNISTFISTQESFFPGQYDVSLTATDNWACSSTEILPVTTVFPFANFSVGNPYNLVCIDALFYNLSGFDVISWEYGDGTNGTLSNHTYLDTGLYNVSLTVGISSLNNCIDDTTISVTVTEPGTDFDFNPKYGCSSPLGVQFTDLSANGSQWFYSFGDGDTSSQQHPFHYYVNQHTGLYDMPDLQHFIPTISVTDSIGCNDFLMSGDTVILDMPVAMFMPNVIYGPAALTVHFSDSSYAPGTIISWFWDFGDGNTITTTTGYVSHTYTQPGLYEVYLTITNNLGCSDVSYPIEIEVLNPTAFCQGNCGPGITMDVCACFPECGTYPNQYYQVYESMFDIFSGCGNLAPPVYTLTQDTGEIDLLYHFYYDSVLYQYQVISPTINVLPPIGHISYEMDCSQPHDFTFHSNAIGADSIVWDFGDSTIIDTGAVLNYSHHYAERGDYIVRLEMYNLTTACVLIDSIEIYVKEISAHFNLGSLPCAHHYTTFESDSSQDVFIRCNSGYEWEFGDMTPIQNTSSSLLVHSYNSGGYYPVTLSVMDINGCKDTYTDTIKIYEIEAGLEIDSFLICSPGHAVLTDLSYSDTTITSWTFHNGLLGTLHYLPDTLFYNLNIDTLLMVSMTATNILGCSDHTEQMVHVSGIDYGISSNESDICLGESAVFQTSENFPTVDWTFNNYGPFTSGSLTFYTFNTVGTYNITATIQDTNGCYHTRSSNNLIEVHNIPDAIIVSEPAEDTICLPVQINFYDSSIINQFGSREWNFYNAAAIIPNQTVTMPYEIPGNYSVTLVETNIFGCTDSVTKNFVVQGPLAEFDIYPDLICQGEDIQVFMYDTSDIVNWIWDFGDGNIDSSQNLQLNYTYNSAYYPSGGQTFISLVYSSSNCEVIKTHDISFFPEVMADYVYNPIGDSIVCLGESVTVYNTSVNASEWEWDLGNGLVYQDNIQEINYTFQDTGVYEISLMASSSNICFDTISRLLTVRSNAQLITPDILICEGDTAELSVSAEGGITKYLWSPEEYFDNPENEKQEITLFETKTFNIKITDGFGCEGTGELTVEVIQTPDPTNWDTTIVIGEIVHLNAYMGDNIMYTWTPDESLDALDIPDPIAFTMDDNTYYVLIKDLARNCYEITNTYSIKVVPETTLDLPSVFTPNGDGINDAFIPQGWGIKELVEMRIFNRWGEKVYESFNSDASWDGTYKGKNQTPDTYIYIVKVKTWLGATIEKKGYINLVR